VGKKKEELSMQESVELFSKIVASNQDLFEIDLDKKIWTSGPQRFAQEPDWHKRGLRTPNHKDDYFSTDQKAFSKLKPFKKDKDGKIKPFKNLVIYPSIDPYEPEIRSICRLLMEENPIILEGSEILQQLVITDSTRTVEPRDEIELPEGSLDKWEEVPIYVPYWDKEISPKELLKWFNGYCKTLDFDELLFDAFLFVREQGRTCIGMFPLERRKNGMLPLPQALKLIRPELLRRPIVNLDTGEMAGVEVSNLTVNGSILDARRAVYINHSKNLELFGDFYGRIPIRSLVDVGKVILFIFGRDWIEAVLQTWHTKPIFKHTLPSKDWSKVKPILDDFNQLMQENINKVVSVTNNVELLNPNGTDSGDITGINEILTLAIKIIVGFDNIPLYMVGHGETGNLGGNANREEVDAFLKTKVKPQQEMYENIAKDQMYDRVLAILWNVEPEQVDQVPIQFLHNFEKPNISVPLTTDEWNIFMFLVDNNYTTMEDVMELFGLRHIMTNPANIGTDTSPASKTYNPHLRNRHPTWSRASGNLRNNRPLKKNFSVGDHHAVSEITQKRGALLDELKLKLRGDKTNDKLKQKLEKDFKMKERQLISKFAKEQGLLSKERKGIKLEREKLAKKNVK